MPKKQLVDAIASLATTQDPAQKKTHQRDRETAKDKHRSTLVKRAFADACVAERKFDNEKQRLADGTSAKKEIRVEDLPGCDRSADGNGELGICESCSRVAGSLTRQPTD